MNDVGAEACRVSEVPGYARAARRRVCVHLASWRFPQMHNISALATAPTGIAPTLACPQPQPPACSARPHATLPYHPARTPRACSLRPAPAARQSDSPRARAIISALPRSNSRCPAARRRAAPCCSRRPPPCPPRGTRSARPRFRRRRPSRRSRSRRWPRPLRRRQRPHSRCRVSVHLRCTDNLEPQPC